MNASVALSGMVIVGLWAIYLWTERLFEDIENIDITIDEDF